MSLLLLHAQLALAAGPITPAVTPLANSTVVVFNSSVSPPGSRFPVACYRIPMICSTASGALVAFAEARMGDGKAGNGCGDW